MGEIYVPTSYTEWGKIWKEMNQTMSRNVYLVVYSILMYYIWLLTVYSQNYGFGSLKSALPSIDNLHKICKFIYILVSDFILRDEAFEFWLK